jgi:uncharacterized coiled-coil DUF342 family protein
MNKTKVDDMLIEMISPKMEEIERRFSSGEALSQDDINTLLLKSQYNHINHLDEKLDETVESVKSLKNEFDLKFNVLKGDFNLLKGEFQTFKAEMMADNEKRFGAMEVKFEALKADIQESISSTMKWYIGGAGIILVVLKTLDIFVK